MFFMVLDPLESSGCPRPPHLCENRSLIQSLNEQEGFIYSSGEKPIHVHLKALLCPGLRDVSGCVLLCGLCLQSPLGDRKAFPHQRSDRVPHAGCWSLTQSPAWTGTALISLSLCPHLLPKTMHRFWECRSQGHPNRESNPVAQSPTAVQAQQISVE